MKIDRSGTRPSTPGSEAYFTGQVRFDPVANVPEPGRLRAAVVTFEPGARTAWHTHPLGQTLLILTGRARVQTEGSPVEELTPGDTVYFAPGERHWHGAAADVAMSHLAMQEAEDGVTADWQDHVTDAEYRGA